MNAMHLCTSVSPDPIIQNSCGSGDKDGDGIPDCCDNCIFAYNPGQENDDCDLTGNDCDSDDDGDGISE